MKDEKVIKIDEKAIKAALMILKPKIEDRDDCLIDIEYAIAMARNPDEEQDLIWRSKEAKRVLKRLLAALTRVHHAQQQLPGIINFEFRMVCDLRGGIAFCERHLKIPSQSPRPPSHRQRAAVTEAFLLVQEWLVRKRGLYKASSVSRESQWHKLSQILFGDARDLLSHLSDFKRQETAVMHSIRARQRRKRGLEQEY